MIYRQVRAGEVYPGDDISLDPFAHSARRVRNAITVSSEGATFLRVELNHPNTDTYERTLDFQIDTINTFVWKVVKE